MAEPTQPVPGWLTALTVTGAGMGAYHGYLRNGGSLGWAVGWSILGSMFPVIAIPVMLAQGLGQPAAGSGAAQISPRAQRLAGVAQRRAGRAR